MLRRVHKARSLPTSNLLGKIQAYYTAPLPLMSGGELRKQPEISPLLGEECDQRVARKGVGINGSG